MYTYTFVTACVCICIYIYIYIHTHKYTHIHRHIPHSIETMTGKINKQYWDSSEGHVPFCTSEP